MSRFRLLTPDAQYPDDAHIERQTSGEQVDWDIYRETVAGEHSGRCTGQLRCDGGVA